MWKNEKTWMAAAALLITTSACSSPKLAEVGRELIPKYAELDAELAKYSAGLPAAGSLKDVDLPASLEPPPSDANTAVMMAEAVGSADKAPAIDLGGGESGGDEDLKRCRRGLRAENLTDTERTHRKGLATWVSDCAATLDAQHYVLLLRVVESVPAKRKADGKAYSDGSLHVEGFLFDRAAKKLVGSVRTDAGIHGETVSYTYAQGTGEETAAFERAAQTHIEAKLKSRMAAVFSRTKGSTLWSSNVTASKNPDKIDAWLLGFHFTEARLALNAASASEQRDRAQARAVELRVALPVFPPPAQTRQTGADALSMLKAFESAREVIRAALVKRHGEDVAALFDLSCDVDLYGTVDPALAKDAEGAAQKVGLGAALKPLFAEVQAGKIKNHADTFLAVVQAAVDELAK